MKKQINAASIADELRGAAFFQKSAPPSAPAPSSAASTAVGLSPPQGQAEHPNGQTERPNRTVLDEIQIGVLPVPERATERYSFEIYTDQKQKIEDVRYQYQKRTGKKISASRLIREGLEEYLAKVLDVLQ